MESSAVAPKGSKIILTNSGEQKVVSVHNPGDQTGKKRGNYKQKDDARIAMKQQLAAAGLQPSADGTYKCLDCGVACAKKYSAERHMLDICSKRFLRFPQLAVGNQIAQAGAALTAVPVASEPGSIAQREFKLALAGLASLFVDDGNAATKIDLPTPKSKKRTRASAMGDEENVQRTTGSSRMIKKARESASISKSVSDESAPASAASEFTAPRVVRQGLHYQPMGYMEDPSGYLPGGLEEVAGIDEFADNVPLFATQEYMDYQMNLEANSEYPDPSSEEILFGYNTPYFQ